MTGAPARRSAAVRFTLSDNNGSISALTIVTGGGPRRLAATRLMRGSNRGRAALLLTESLMHALVAQGTISREVFIEVVEGAADVERDMTNENATPPADRDGSLLSPPARAFRQELGGYSKIQWRGPFE